MFTRTANAVLLATFPGCLILGMWTLAPHVGLLPFLLVAGAAGIGFLRAIHLIVSVRRGIAMTAIAGGIVYGALAIQWLSVDRHGPILALGIAYLMWVNILRGARRMANDERAAQRPACA